MRSKYYSEVARHNRTKTKLATALKHISILKKCIKKDYKLPKPLVKEIIKSESRNKNVLAYSSTVTRFIKECCYFDHGKEVSGTNIYNAFIKWCLENAPTEAISQKKFGTIMGTIGLKKRKSGTILYAGITLNVGISTMLSSAMKKIAHKTIIKNSILDTYVKSFLNKKGVEINTETKQLQMQILVRKQAVKDMLTQLEEIKNESNYKNDDGLKQDAVGC
jgi:phage/plasmid-associated DNA primase